MRNIKHKIKILVNRFSMFSEFYHDYRDYKRWNYNNPKVHTKAAQESKILRQTHMIEKGMSLSNPRKGFGQSKIKDLFDMLDEYIRLGFPTAGTPFQNAIVVLNEYVNLQKMLEYSNAEMEEKLSQYQKYLITDQKAGIFHTTKSEIENEIKGEFPEFFFSRHSMRQFSNVPVSISNIEKAVRLAQKSPTACNRQASRVYYYSDKKTNQEIGNLIAGNTGFEQEIQNYLVITADISAFYDTFERNQIYVEAGIFSMALVEALHYYGVASCVLQNGEYYKKNKKFKEICGNIPENEKIILFIAIGYYKEEITYAASMRKLTEDVLITK